MDIRADYQTRAVPPSVAAPKAIGLLQRVEGVRSGLDEICARLYGLSCRIDGCGQDAGANPSPIPAGLPGNLTECEDRVRRVLAIIGQLEEAF